MLLTGWRTITYVSLCSIVHYLAHDVFYPADRWLPPIERVLSSQREKAHRSLLYMCFGWFAISSGMRRLKVLAGHLANENLLVIYRNARRRSFQIFVKWPRKHYLHLVDYAYWYFHPFLHPSTHPSIKFALTLVWYLTPKPKSRIRRNINGAIKILDHVWRVDGLMGGESVLGEQRA